MSAFHPIVDMGLLANDDAMPLDLSFEDQITDGFARAQSNPAFHLNRWWLTFYLTSEPRRLEAVAQQLAAFGGENLDDTSSGWLYAKVPAYPDLVVIRASAVQVAAICDAHGVWLSSIDADTSAEAGSTFEELYRSETPPRARRVKAPFADIDVSADRPEAEEWLKGGGGY